MRLRIHSSQNSNHNDFQPRMNTDKHGCGTGLMDYWSVGLFEKSGRSIFRKSARRFSWHPCSSVFVHVFSILIFGGLISRTFAQALPPDDFFHGGAMAYLTNNVPAALDRVTNGLALYPNDEKLKKLEELLKQQQQQQNQQQQKQDQQQNQQQKDQSKQDQKDQKQDQQQSKDQNKSDQEKQKEQQKKEQEKKDQQQANQQQAKKSEDEKEKPEEQQQASAGQMTPQEAKQLLDAQKNDEAMLPFNQAEKPRNRRVPLKDW
jgi:hypothetical protein